VDINPKKLARVGKPTEKAEIYAWLKKQPDNSIPNIFFHHALEHCANPQQIINQIGRVLKGVCFIEVPSEEAHSVHVSFIKSIKDIIPEGVEVLYQTDAESTEIFRVVFKKC
jgi:ubiquinone/menaquinone biosynthesis C-methylase UbiE